jgi:hypothetical protein
VAHIFYIIFTNRTKTGDHGEWGQGGGGPVQALIFVVVQLLGLKVRPQCNIFKFFHRKMLPNSGRPSAFHTKSRKTKKKERRLASLPLLR